MIYFFITRKHAYTINTFIHEWAAETKKYLQVITYDQLSLIQHIMPGAFIFSDLERLNDNQLACLEDFCGQVTAFNAQIPIINHPRNVLTRFKLLRHLHAVGFNKFKVYPAADLDAEPRYPVFLRINNDHGGPRSGLLTERTQRDAALLQAVMVGFDLRQLLQVEFLETKSQDGYYRKYSTFRIGDHIIPGHIIFSKDWAAKEGEPPDEERRREQEFYMTQNPHAEEVLELFALAGIRYGRIDYSMHANTIQTWEINTNPVLVKPRREYKPQYIAPKEKLVAQLKAAILSLDYGGDLKHAAAAGSRISLQWQPRKYF